MSLGSSHGLGDFVAGVDTEEESKKDAAFVLVPPGWEKVMFSAATFAPTANNDGTNFRYRLEQTGQKEFVQNTFSSNGENKIGKVVVSKIVQAIFKPAELQDKALMDRGAAILFPGREIDAKFEVEDYTNDQGKTYPTNKITDFAPAGTKSKKKQQQPAQQQQQPNTAASNAQPW